MRGEGKGKTVGHEGVGTTVGHKGKGTTVGSEGVMSVKKVKREKSKLSWTRLFRSYPC